MRRQSTTCLLALILMLSGLGTAYASLADYTFAASTQTFSALTSYSTALSTYNTVSSSTGTYGDSATTSSYTIGFGFKFDCGTYNYFSLNANGTVALGTSTAPRLAQRLDALNASRYYPIIAPLWQWQHLYSGYCITTGVRYYRSGSSPNRILTIEWQTQIVGVSGGVPSHYWIGCTTSMLQYQAKLYEGTNKIEFIYGRLSNGGIPTSATIGLGVSSTDWVSVTPGTTASASTSWLNNSIDLNDGSLQAGTSYTFTPVGERFVGLTGPGNGGTATMVSGDTLFSGFTEQVGNAGVYTPLTIARGCPAGSASYSLDIGGESAANYRFVSNGGITLSTSLAGGSSLTPAIRFVPSHDGDHPATLRVRNNSTATSRTYILNAAGFPRIVYVGDLAQGGTTASADGDRLLTNIALNRTEDGTYTPFRIENSNAAPNWLTAPVTITVTLDSAGFAPQQYHLVDPVTGDMVSSITTAVGPLETFTPQIHFLALGAGEQISDLIVTTSDGEDRTFQLAAGSIAPGGSFVAGGENLAGSLQFLKVESCIGDLATSIPVTITSIGLGVPLRVESVRAWLLDTVYGQGRPPQPLLLENGLPVPMPDYVLSDVEGSASPANLTRFPIVLEPGQTRTVYLVFRSGRAGKRYARVFVNSNAQNFGADDLAGVRQNGLLTFEAIGSGIGGMLAADLSGTRLGPAVFPITRVRDSSMTTILVSNPGMCDLRISSRHLYLTTGDIGEFRVLSAMTNSGRDGVTGDYILPAGTTDSIVVLFKPTRGGSRMATLWIRSNDSSIVSGTGDLRGEVFLDLYGTATAGLDGRDIAMSPVLIGSSTAAFLTLENSVTTPIMADFIGIAGPDAAEFTEDLSAPWPSRPARVLPGDKLRLSVRFSPVGLPGMRTAELIVVTGTGDTTRLMIQAEAGTQDLVVGPADLFGDISILVGESVRRTVMISNAGTLPVRLTSVVITGTDAVNYRLGAMPRMDIQPGGTEHVEITFAPELQGESSAQLEVRTAGAFQIVSLRGSGMRVRDDGDDREIAVPDGTSGAGDALTGYGVALGEPRPIPARDAVTLDLRLDAAKAVRVDLVDLQGRSVATVDYGTMAAGTHQLRLSLTELPAGFYHARVVCGDRAFARSVIVR